AGHAASAGADPGAAAEPSAGRAHTRCAADASAADPDSGAATQPTTSDADARSTADSARASAHAATPADTPLPPTLAPPPAPPPALAVSLPSGSQMRASPRRETGNTPRRAAARRARSIIRRLLLPTDPR